MTTKKDYINLIRWSCIIDYFTRYYFLRIIVIYLLDQGVTPWVAVSIPIVLEFSRLISRAFNFLAKFALKVDFKNYHIFHLLSTLVLGLIISQCRSVFTIYLFAIISGFLSGIRNSTLTKLNTQNKEYEPYCFIEEERAAVIGSTLGLLISQFIYDINPFLYFIGLVVLTIIGIIFSLFLKRVPNEDIIESIDDAEVINKENKKNIVLITSLYAILVGLWCLGLGGFTELAPLISDKIGYLESIYTILEIILLCLISGSLLAKIKEKGRLLLSETVIACLDTMCLLIAAVTLSWQGLIFAYIIMAFTSTLGDPIWGSIMSVYSANDRKNWVLTNKVYFIIRGIFQIITWFICRDCVIMGVESFKYLAIILIVLILILYIIANMVNKKVFGRSI